MAQAFPKEIDWDDETHRNRGLFLEMRTLRFSGSTGFSLKFRVLGLGFRFRADRV